MKVEMIMNYRKSSIWREELRRATTPKRLFALLFLVAIILFAGWSAIQRRVPFDRSFIDNWYGIYVDSYYPQLIALLAAFPFSDSLVIDRKQGYLNQLIARVPFRKLMSAKVCINAIIGGLAASLPLGGLYLITTFFTKAPLNHPSVDQMALRPSHGLLRDFYMSSPDGFIVAVIAMVFLMGAVFATLGLASSLAINNRLIAIGAPLVLFNALQFFAERTRLVPNFLTPLRSLLARSMADTELITTASEIPSLFILPFLVLLLSLALFLIFGKRERVLENEPLFTLKTGTVDSEKQIQATGAIMVDKPAGFSGKAARQSQRLVIARKNKNKWLKPGSFLARFYVLATRVIRPLYWLILIASIVATGILFSRFLANAGAMGLPPNLKGETMKNAWDVVFVALGNPYVMTLLMANGYLIIISAIQPETGFGQISLFRLNSRKKNWAYQVLFLFFTAVLYVAAFILGVYFVAILNGYAPASAWSAITARGGTWVNLPHWLPLEQGLWSVIGMLWALLSLGFFALGIMVFTLNVLFNRRLVGYLVVALFLLSSIGLTLVFVNQGIWLRMIPLIQNLIFIDPIFKARAPGLIPWLYAYWAVILAVLVPLSFYLYKRQDFAVKTDEE